MYHVISSRL